MTPDAIERPAQTAPQRPVVGRETAFLYLDESKDRHEPGTFVIGVLSTPKPGELGREWSHAEEELYAEGWPRGTEIKASSLYNSQDNKDIPNCIQKHKHALLQHMLYYIWQLELKIDYAYFRQSERPDHLRRKVRYGNKSKYVISENCIYNFAAGKVVLAAMSGVHLSSVNLTVDQRTVDPSVRRFFDGHIETVAAIEAKYPDKLKIAHQPSNAFPQLRAADFACFALRRSLGHNDQRFILPIRHLISSGHKVF
ncbi:MAG: DUF3800 domain-containing protein [Planctomycetes bacterium]|nr:DUF3800 domain-containing protein [Planctomycetota bacterium]